MVREIPPLRDSVNDVLAHARYGAIAPILTARHLVGRDALPALIR